MRTSVVLLCSVVLFLASCTPPTNSPPVSSFGINYGPEVPLVSTTVSSAGGTVRVASGSDTLKGLEIDVPNASYGSSVTFNVSYAPITSIKGDDDFNPIAPLVIIDNGGDIAQTPMTLKVPIKLPDDEFAMAFAYNDDGSLEALPVLDEDATSITVWTLHFNYSGIHEVSRMAGKHEISGSGKKRTLLVIISQKKAKVMALNYTCPFTPGTDDWPFKNYGSTVEPNGHCAGQSLGMMYYYIDRKVKRGDANLNSRFDNDGDFATPQIPLDDRSAYRFCSVLQQSLSSFFNSYDYIDRALTKLGKPQTFHDSLVFMTFKLSVYKTKRPQFVAIYTADTQKGHAMVVYGGTPTELKICDPNYAGVVTRTIPFSGGVLGPYNSGPNADHLGTSYTQIRFWGTTAGLDWGVAQREWPHLLDHSTGATLFPTYTVQVQDGDGAAQNLSGGVTVKSGKARLTVTSTQKPLMVLRSYAKDGTIIPDSAGWHAVPDGTNQFGLLITDTAKKWAGFSWVNVEAKKEISHTSSGSGKGIMPLRTNNEWHWDETTYAQDGTINSQDESVLQIGNGNNRPSNDSDTWGYTFTGYHLPFDDYRVEQYGGQLQNDAEGLDWIKDFSFSKYLAAYPAKVGDIFGKQYWSQFSDTTSDYVVLSTNSSVSANGQAFTCYVYASEYKIGGRVLSSAETDALFASFPSPVIVFSKTYYAPGIGLVKYEEYSVSQGTRYLSRTAEIKWYTIH